MPSSRHSPMYSETFSEYASTDVSRAAIICAGAFDCFGGRRSQLASVSEKLIDAIAASRRQNVEGQTALPSASRRPHRSKVRAKQSSSMDPVSSSTAA